MYPHCCQMSGGYKTFESNTAPGACCMHCLHRGHSSAILHAAAHDIQDRALFLLRVHGDLCRRAHADMARHVTCSLLMSLLGRAHQGGINCWAKRRCRQGRIMTLRSRLDVRCRATPQKPAAFVFTYIEPSKNAKIIERFNDRKAPVSSMAQIGKAAASFVRMTSRLERAHADSSWAFLPDAHCACVDALQIGAGCFMCASRVAVRDW